jgi:hypothetical protein
MKNTARVLATATVGLGLAVALGAPAQAANVPTPIIAGADTFSWTPVGDDCFFADVLANDAPHPQQITHIKVLSGAVTATQGNGPSGTAMEVCPAAGLKSGAISITYIPLAITGADGGYVYGPDGRIGAISDVPVAVTITVVAPPEPSAPTTTSPSASAAASATEITIVPGKPTTFVVSSLSDAGTATAFTQVSGPVGISATVDGSTGAIRFNASTTATEGPYTFTYTTDAGTTGHVDVKVIGGVEAQPAEHVRTEEETESAAAAASVHATDVTRSVSGTSGRSLAAGIAMSLLGAFAPVGSSILKRRR